MSKKSSVIIFIIVAFSIVGGITLAFNSKSAVPTPSAVEIPTTPSPSTIPTPVTASPSGTKKPVTTTPAMETSNMYTLAQVAAHNSRTDCWTVVNASVYNVTTWINQHPGGAQAIVGMCGIDASSEFNDQHGGQRRPENELAGFKIGTLIK